MSKIKNPQTTLTATIQFHFPPNLPDQVKEKNKKHYYPHADNSVILNQKIRSNNLFQTIIDNFNAFVIKLSSTHIFINVAVFTVPDIIRTDNH